MSLTAILNPLSRPGYEEALVFHYSTSPIPPEEGDQPAVNLGVHRFSLTDRKDYFYTDLNKKSFVPLVNPAGIDIAFYNGAPRVFGFTKVDENAKENDGGDGGDGGDGDRPVQQRITQLSPTTTPIDKDDEGPVKGKFKKPLATIYDLTKGEAYLFALRPTNKVDTVELIYYVLGDSRPYGRPIPIHARPDSQLDAIIHVTAKKQRYFFQPSGGAEVKNIIRWAEIDSDKWGDVPGVVAWESSPIAVVNGIADLEDEEAPKEYLYVYYVATNQRVHRARYDYHKREQDDNDRWDKEPVEISDRTITKPWRWLKVVPFTPTENWVFFLADNEEPVRLKDTVSKTRSPAVEVPPKLRD
ncbi:hypothetical protein BDV24DRAFT_907 [Aspergillus arachidicola]|uniref:Uncharacterized protein n=1 Tax=Aspergillus arachidicola TaxID=656916 RepID=A0A5N6YVP8_9EURO|nr:hypothetical protein BDV24DRAFT_907 [Aspergillus arachidicola]